MSFEKLTEEIEGQAKAIAGLLADRTVGGCAIGEGRRYLEGQAEAYADVLRIIESLDACGRKECDYYKHYLAYGPASVSHEEYHAASAKCEYWQLKAERWYEEHSAGELPQSVERQCRFWEEKVRA